MELFELTLEFKKMKFGFCNVSRPAYLNVVGQILRMQRILGIARKTLVLAGVLS